MIGLKSLKDGGYYKFVRRGEVFAFGLIGEREVVRHSDLAKELELGDEKARSPRTDMGCIGVAQGWRYITVERDSVGYDWPTEENFDEIRDETIGMLEDAYPEIEIRKGRY